MVYGGSVMQYCSFFLTKPLNGITNVIHGYKNKRIPQRGTITNIIPGSSPYVFVLFLLRLSDFNPIIEPGLLKLSMDIKADEYPNAEHSPTIL